ncbi:MAG: ferritin-like domain-containing protein [Candidatus Promineifilaceae bacterium]|nr:ferritin-like domain-containing protein [Candidatus Promineifilaceae bacterium]
MNFNRLQDLLVHELEDLLSAEQMLVDALQKMSMAATDPELKQAFTKHMERTRDEHVGRLHEAFQKMNHAPQTTKCKGMEGIIKEGEEITRATGDPATRDAALIGAAQRAEHYEMAAYGTARAHANELGHDEVADLLQETLDNEGKTNQMLTKLAEGGLLSKGINPKAEAD